MAGARRERKVRADNPKTMRPARGNAVRPGWLKPAIVFALAAAGVVALVFLGYLRLLPEDAPNPDYRPVTVRGLVDSPADYAADEYYTYTITGRSARVEGIVFKPTPCDSVKASAVRDLATGAITVRLEFSDRGTACDEVITPSKFELSVDNASSNDLLHLTAGTRPLQLNATTQFCGGIAAFGCPRGWQCALDGDYPDAGGKCVRAA